MILEKYRPSNLDQFIGNIKAISAVAAYMNSVVEADAVLLCGPQGVGKTTLAHCFAQTYDMIPLEQNGSSQRKKADSKRVMNVARSRAMVRDNTPKKRLLIVDEADGAKDAYLSQILKLPGKKILTCNNPAKISWTIRAKMHVVYLKPPTKRDLKTFCEANGFAIDDYSIFNSWRNLLNFLMGGDSDGPTYLTEREEAEILLCGKQRHPFQSFDLLKSSKVSKLLSYFLYNGGDPSVAAEIDILLHSGKRQTKLAADILMAANLSAPIKRPPYVSTKSEQATSNISVKFLGFSDD